MGASKETQVRRSGLAQRVGPDAGIRDAGVSAQGSKRAPRSPSHPSDVSFEVGWASAERADRRSVVAAEGKHPTRRLRTRILVPAAVLLSLALTPGLRAQTSQASDEAKSHALVNSARAAAGLGSLADQQGLDSMARAQAARMASRRAIYHNPTLEADADAAGVDWQWIGENVGVGYDIEELHDGLMNSPPHHENIVYSQYNAIGVGVVTGDDGRMYVAQVFATVAEATAPPAPATVAPPAAPLEASSAPASTTELSSAPSTTAPEQDGTSATSEPASADPNALVRGVVNLDLVF